MHFVCFESTTLPSVPLSWEDGEEEVLFDLKLVCELLFIDLIWFLLWSRVMSTELLEIQPQELKFTCKYR